MRNDAARRYGGEPPAGVGLRTWHEMVRDGACGIADMSSQDNNCTPEEYAAAALRAALTPARLRRITGE